MSGIRDHKVYGIIFKYRQQIRQSDGGGGSEFVGYADSLTTDVWHVLAPTKEIALAWAGRKFGYKDYEVTGIDEGVRLDALIEEHVW